MGLGKTLTTLSLICHHLDQASPDCGSLEEMAISAATLIVTPKSSMVTLLPMIALAL